MEWLIYILFALAFIAITVHIFRVLRPHPRTMTSDSEIHIPLTGIVYKLKQSFFPPTLPTTASDGQAAIAATSKDDLPDLARNRPVIYLGRQIFLESKDGGIKNLELWGRDGYYMRYSVNKGHYPSNLTDGDPSTMAYPGSWFVDYVVDLGARCKIQRIMLDWGAFGEDSKYITSWTLYSQEKYPEDGEANLQREWTLVRSGKSPGEQVTTFSVDGLVAWRFRITAESIDIDNRLLLNWIGIREFGAYGQRIN